MSSSSPKLAGPFVEYLRRSQIAEWSRFYADLDAVALAIDSNLNSSKNKEIGEALKTLKEINTDFQLSVRASFFDGWTMPLPFLQQQQQQQQQQQKEKQGKVDATSAATAAAGGGDSNEEERSEGKEQKSEDDDKSPTVGDLAVAGKNSTATLMDGMMDSWVRAKSHNSASEDTSALAVNPGRTMIFDPDEKRSSGQLAASIRAHENQKQDDDEKGDQKQQQQQQQSFYDDEEEDEDLIDDKKSKFSLNIRSARCLVTLNSLENKPALPCLVRCRSEAPFAEPRFKILPPPPPLSIVSAAKAQQEQEQQEEEEMKEKGDMKEKGGNNNDNNNEPTSTIKENTNNNTTSSLCNNNNNNNNNNSNSTKSSSNLLFVDGISSEGAHWVVRLVSSDVEQVAPVVPRTSSSGSISALSSSSPTGSLAASPQAGTAVLSPERNKQKLPLVEHLSPEDGTKIFSKLTKALATLQNGYRGLARVLLKQIRKVNTFYQRQSEVLASAVASCVDAAKCAKFLSDRRRVLYISAFRETYGCLDMLQEFCEQNIVAFTKAFDAIEQLHKSHITLDTADALCRFQFSLTKNSGLQLLRGDLIDAFRRSYLILKLVPEGTINLTLDFKPPSALPTPTAIEEGDEKNTKNSATVKIEEQQKKNQEADSGELPRPISAREARKLLQNVGDGGGGGFGGGFRGGAANDQGGGGGGGGVGDNRQYNWWNLPRPTFLFLMGISLGLLAAAATEFFSLQHDDLNLIRYIRHAWFHFTVSFAFVAMLFAWGAMVMIWEEIGVNYVFLFSLDPLSPYWKPWTILYRASVYFFLWALCAYAYCRRAVQEETGWLLRSAVINSMNIVNTSSNITITTTTTTTTTNANTTSSNSTSSSLFDDCCGPDAIAWIFPYCIWPLFSATWLYYQLSHDSKNYRRWFIPTLLRVLVTPYHSVTFSDFIFAACCVTLGTMWFELQHFWCTFQPQEEDTALLDACFELRAFRVLFLRLIPILWRMAQCFRNYYKVPVAKRNFFPHGWNAIKYVVVIFALCSRMFLGLAKRTWSDKKSEWISADAIHDNEALVDGAIATFFVCRTLDGIYRSTWDVMIDCGLLPQKEAGAVSKKKTVLVVVDEKEEEQDDEEQQLEEKENKKEDDDKKEVAEKENPDNNKKKTPILKSVIRRKVIVVKEAETNNDDYDLDDRVATQFHQPRQKNQQLVVYPRMLGGPKEEKSKTTTTTTTTSSSSSADQKNDIQNPGILFNATTTATTSSSVAVAEAFESPTIFIEYASDSDDEDDEEGEEELEGNDQKDHLSLPNSASETAPTTSARYLTTAKRRTTTTTTRPKPLQVSNFLKPTETDSKFRQVGIRTPFDQEGTSSSTSVHDGHEEEDDDENDKANETEEEREKREQRQRERKEEAKRKAESANQLPWCCWKTRPLLMPLWFYPLYIIVDIIIRFSWIGRYFAGQVTHRRSEWIPVVFVSLAILRRFLWLIVRVETEQVSNIELYKTTKAAPPPSSRLLFSAGRRRRPRRDGDGDGDQDADNNVDDAGGGGDERLATVWDDAASVLKMSSTQMAQLEASSSSSSKSKKQQQQQQQQQQGPESKRPSKINFSQSSIDRFFALLPRGEKLAITRIAIPLTHRRPTEDFSGKPHEGKSAWFSSLRNELKVHALLARIGSRRTLNDYVTTLHHPDESLS